MRLPDFMENEVFNEIITSMNINEDDFVDCKFEGNIKHEMRSFSSRYSRDWKYISQKYKKFKHYKCEVCGLDCYITRYYLHVHHINGNRYNNNYRNLKCICRNCNLKNKL